MMNWFFVAIIAPFIWSLINYADKFVISKYFTADTHTSVKALVIFSSLFTVVTLPFIVFFHPQVFGTDNYQKFYLILTGVVFEISIVFYFYAISSEDTSLVIPFFQLAPIFGYILGLIFLKEVLSQQKIIGGIVTIMGALVLSIEWREGVKLRIKSVMFIALSSLFLAISDTIFKGNTITGDFWTSMFWTQVGIVIFGLTCLLGKSFREDFLNFIKMSRKKFGLISINIITEIFLIVANFVNFFAMLLAPISLVLLVNYTFQPLFVFIEGIVLTFYLPNVIKEDISRKQLLQKIFSIFIMAVGVYLVYN